MIFLLAGITTVAVLAVAGYYGRKRYHRAQAQTRTTAWTQGYQYAKIEAEVRQRQAKARLPSL